jgi:hypothetical protein
MLGALVTAVWLTVGGILIVGYEGFAIVAGWEFSGLILGAGLAMTVVGALLGAHLLRKL